MATIKYAVTLDNGLVEYAYARDEAGAIVQAERHDRDRFVIAIKRGFDPGPSPGRAVSAAVIPKR